MSGGTPPDEGRQLGHAETIPPPAQPHRSRRGRLTLLLGVVALGLLVAVTFVSLALLRLGPFAPAATPSAAMTPAPSAASPNGGSGFSSPRPTLPGEPTPTAAASTDPPHSIPPTTQPTEPIPPTTAPAVSPIAVPTSPGADADAWLLDRVPQALREGCTPGEPDEAVAVLTCPTPGGDIVATYFVYADATVLSETYDGFVALSGIDPDSGSCPNPETWPAEGEYRVSGQVIGRVLCTELEEGPVIYWTDDRLSILVLAAGAPDEAEDLFDFWQAEAGPVP